jgi:GntR family transcriptional regulator
VIPFRVAFRPGTPLHDQIVYAATKAIIAGQMRPGDVFPSVRTLSRELKINPNTAHKVVASLLSSKLLESKPGVGTIITNPPESSRAKKTQLLGPEIEQLVVEAKRLGVTVDEVLRSVRNHWESLGGKNESEGRTRR